jgi:multiple sugar transport system substrate-binding protein
MGKILSDAQTAQWRAQGSMSRVDRRQLLAAAAGSVLASAGAARAQAPLVLQASYSSGAFRELMTQAAAEFERQPDGCRIEWRAPVVASMEDHLQMTLRWAVTGDLPDVSFQANNHIRLLASRDLTVPLDRFIAAEPAWDELGYAASVREIGRVGDQIHGLPFQMSVPVNMFNLALVRRAGGDPDALPRDWDATIALARRIRAADPTVLGAYFDFGAAGSWTFQALIASQGGRMMNPDERTIAFDGPEGLFALELIRRIGETGPVDMSQEQMFQAFGAGQIGILAATNNMIGAFERQAAGRFAIGAVPWPLLSPAGRLPAGGRTAVMFTRDPARQAAAWRFIKFMTGPAVQARVATLLGAVPANLIALRRPELLGRFYDEHPAHRAGVERVGVMTAWYDFPGPSSVRIAQVIREQLRRTAMQQAAPAQAMAEMTREVAALLPRT